MGFNWKSIFKKRSEVPRSIWKSSTLLDNQRRKDGNYKGNFKITSSERKLKRNISKFVGESQRGPQSSTSQIARHVRITSGVIKHPTVPSL